VPFLAYEGAEKVWEKFAPHAAHAHEEALTAGLDPVALEEAKVAAAIKTDFILSAEIMAIALATIPTAGLLNQGVVLAVVGIAIMIAVYGGVALIVKAERLWPRIGGERLGCLACCWPRPCPRDASVPPGPRWPARPGCPGCSRSASRSAASGGAADAGIPRYPTRRRSISARRRRISAASSGTGGADLMHFRRQRAC
jgi:hypothetical protein